GAIFLAMDEDSLSIEVKHFKEALARQEMNVEGQAIPLNEILSKFISSNASTRTYSDRAMNSTLEK
ncbi:MAG: hypothetical protein QW369_07750, partial [Desulfurococcaceae archaeon]